MLFNIERGVIGMRSLMLLKAGWDHMVEASRARLARLRKEAENQCFAVAIDYDAESGIYFEAPWGPGPQWVLIPYNEHNSVKFLGDNVIAIAFNLGLEKFVYVITKNPFKTWFVFRFKEDASYGKEWERISPNTIPPMPIPSLFLNSSRNLAKLR